jgi:CHAD domain-containing protein
MAFRFKLAEPFEDGIRRIAREQIERAQAQLKGSDDPVVAVHETRKALKRLRALLRLIRPALGESIYRDENVRLREIGAGLSSTRDRHVLLETVLKLETGTSLGSKGLAQRLRDVIIRANGTANPEHEAAAIKQAHARLGVAKKRFAHLNVDNNGFDIVAPGLEQCYRKARRALHRAYAEPSDEAFHDWRKGTQRHWRHMVLLSRAWSACFDARIAEARALSQILGDDHDLALLVGFIHSGRAEELEVAQIAAVEEAARQRQSQLRAMAHPRGLRLFAEGPRNLRRRVAAYWEAAVALKEQEPDEEEPKDAAKDAPKDAPQEAPTERAKAEDKKPLRPAAARRRASATQAS